MFADQIAPLADAIYRDRVRRAREEPPGQKLLDSLRLYDIVVEQNKSGIRHQFPEADEARVHEILLQRMARLRRVQEHGLYFPVEEPVP